MTYLGQRSIMHIVLIYKLIAKVQRIKANQKIVQNFLKPLKIKILNFCQKAGASSPPSHLDLTMSSLGDKEPPHQQNKNTKTQQ